MGFTIPPSPMEVARSLMAQKDVIQAELDAQYAILSANNSTLQTPLVDPQGFPRGDIDVYAVRHARVRIIELKNDMESIIDKLAKALEGVYDPRRSGSVTEDPSSVSSKPSSSNIRKEHKVFAKVDGVVPESPAAHAGLLREDLILKFGTLTSASFPTQSLQPIAELVAAHEGQTVDVVVLRKDHELTLLVTPRKGWSSRGLLGCHIVPFTLP